MYLLTITSYVSFTILIPAACALGIAALFSEKLRAALGKLAWHLLLFALAIAFAIPAGVKVSSMIEDTYRASIEETIANAEQTTEDIQSATSGEADEGEKSGLSGLFSKVTEGITGAATAAVGQIKTVLNRFIEALAVMLVTSCLIPILVLLFFAWLVKLMLGIELPPLRVKLGKIAARVIAKDSGNWFQVFRIDKGADDGIQEDMNVMAGGGLVGIVTDVGANYATVRAIIDDDSNVSGMSLRTGDTCNVSGNLTLYQDGRLGLDHIKKEADIQEGDKIVTSNISDIFLPGILIGYASGLTTDANNVTKSGTIIPVADFDNLQEVLVITQLKNGDGGDNNAEAAD